ncbi:MAG: hypothetical protein R3C15_03645 [Thermoleophilia bacterium]
MSPTIDERLRAFRADQPGPAPDAVDRILDLPLRERPRRAGLLDRLRRPVAFVPAVCAVGAAAALAVLFWPGGDRPGLLERAAAAIAPSGEIVHLTFTVRYQTLDERGTWVDDELVTMHDFSLYEGDRLVRMRRFISDGPLGSPPSDEDTSVVVRPDGALEATSWVAGELRTGADDLPPVEQLSVAGMLRAAYAAGALREVSRSGDSIVLRASGGTDRLAGDGQPCADDGFAEVVVDATTFLPAQAIERFCTVEDGPAQLETRQLLAFTATETLPDTAANRALLEVGDWPLGTAGAPAVVPDEDGAPTSSG